MFMWWLFGNGGPTLGDLADLRGKDWLVVVFGIAAFVAVLMFLHWRIFCEPWLWSIASACA